MSGAFILVSWASFAGLLSWTFYAAVEPYVRRRWPQMLISWSRLLDGRWRDPLVGRDLLIGNVLGLALHLLYPVATVASSWRGKPAGLEISNPAHWFGLHLVVADALVAPAAGIWVALGLVVLLVVLRLVLRSEWAAAIGVVPARLCMGRAPGGARGRRRAGRVRVLHRDARAQGKCVAGCVGPRCSRGPEANGRQASTPR